MPASALAQTAPDQGLFALKYVDYRDWQPGGDRIHVHSPSLYLLKPLSDSLAAEGSLVYDGISGASPLYHNTLSGASGKGGVTDYRTAGDVKLTKYFDGAAVGVGAAISSERDYLSRALSLDVRVSSDDRNRTYAFGIGGASDDINSTNGVAEGQAPAHRRPAARRDPGAVGRSDRSVEPDLVGQDMATIPTRTRPSTSVPTARRILAWLTRYNQHLPRSDATLSLSYRYVRDSFGSDSHTVEAAWHQPLADGWSIKPGIALLHAGRGGLLFRSAVSAGIFVRRAVHGRYAAVGVRRADPGSHGRQAAARMAGRSMLKVEFYRQRSDWRPGGGSPGLEPLSARWIETGISKTF